MVQLFVESHCIISVGSVTAYNLNNPIALFMILIDQKCRKFDLCKNLVGYDSKGLGVLTCLYNLQASSTYWYISQIFDDGHLTLNWKHKNIKHKAKSYKICEPERTSSVLHPAFCPNKMSVSNLSPTIHILDVGMLYLKSQIWKSQLPYHHITSSC